MAPSTQNQNQRDIRLLTEEEAAAAIGLSQQRLKEIRLQRRRRPTEWMPAPPPHAFVGSRPRYLRADLEIWVHEVLCSPRPTVKRRGGPGRPTKAAQIAKRNAAARAHAP